MSEIIFLIEEDPGGGYTARTLCSDFSIFTEGENIEELKKKIIEAVECHFDDTTKLPSFIRLHFVRDEVIQYAPTT